MTCLVQHLEDLPCILCKRADQVYIGHGTVRFCAHCSISWDPIEDEQSLDLQRKAVILSEDQDGELPEDMIERMGALIGSINTVFVFDRRLVDMMAIPEILFTEDQVKHLLGQYDQIQSAPQPADKQKGKAADDVWRSLVSTFSPVMQLIHDAMRMNSADTRAMTDELFKARKVEFNDAVSDYVSQLGCGGVSDLRAQVELKFLREDSERDARDITNTHNLDLAKTIEKIKTSVPTANRATYTKGLREWESRRRLWKNTQIALWTTMNTRDQALKSFAFHNNLKPEVELMPKLAKEPICQGWVNRGKVTFEIAVRNPSPYHLNCVHFWKPDFVGIEKDCSNLWKG